MQYNRWTICDNANAIEEIREDTNVPRNVIVTELNLSGSNSKDTNGMCTIYIYIFFLDLLSSDITCYNFNAKDMCIINKNSYDIEQCNTTDVTCDKSDNNLTICENANVIEEMREDTNVPRNVIVTELNLSGPNSKDTNGMCTIYIYIFFL